MGLARTAAVHAAEPHRVAAGGPQLLEAARAPMAAEVALLPAPADQKSLGVVVALETLRCWPPCRWEAAAVAAAVARAVMLPMIPGGNDQGSLRQGREGCQKALQSAHCTLRPAGKRQAQQMPRSAPALAAWPNHPAAGADGGLFKVYTERVSTQTG